MSERPVIKTDPKVSETELEKEIAKLKARHERKAKLVSVLDRGLTGDRQQVELPSDIYGEWVPNDKMEIYRMESMGFKIDKQYACKRALHDSGIAGESIIADTIFMTCDRETKEIIEEIKQEQYIAANSPRGGKQKEEKQFESDAEVAGLPVDAKQRSRIDPANLEAIKAAVTAQT